MMQPFFSDRKNFAWLIAVMALMALNLVSIIYRTPMVPEQEWAQKIFYLHVPSAWTGFLSYFIVMVAGIMFLSKKDQKWDRVGLAAAEIGTLFIALVLITGPVWAKPIWGRAWIWEPRLTTTLVLFLIYIGYFMMRSFSEYPERAARTAAVLGIIAFADVPLIFLSVKFWSPEIQSHPQVEMASQPPGILLPFLFSLFCFTILYFLMLRYRIHVLKLHDRKDRNGI
ncbi:MAG: cytochrome c biogenesis protein CcsA [Candidatus Marinimicrobia bacterium]|jgi:heme exporter protein C|nr:cytochrome c biogenesis protein CcsA [Candidatus Neomarinimicrobiota bacterium]